MRKRLLATLFAFALLATACAPNDSGISTRLDEYDIELESSSAPAGDVALSVRNAGEIAHQLVVLRTGRDPDDLPVKDGVVPTDGKGIDEAGSIELLAAGASQTLTIDLEAGRYVLICNIAGHYGSGMYTSFLVR